jgi:MoaA/NifB/PqqE/SkfB family radical SAM enzyme
MEMKKVRAEIGGNGQLMLPEEYRLRYGLKPGAFVYIDETAKGPRLRLPVTHLNKIYIEPTNQCNLDCRTCIRKSWDESPGRMSMELFASIMDGLKEFSPPPALFFGALGEPLLHPDIVDMVVQAKASGSSVELITNGTLLTKSLSTQLIDAGLDMLWVSLDGTTPESYGDVRQGAILSEVLANLKAFRKAGWTGPSGRTSSGFHITPEIGIVFVAMKSNIHELPALLTLATGLGAARVMVSNVLPYTGEMSREVLYTRSLTDAAYRSSVFRLDLPRIDIDERTRRSLYDAMRARHSVSLGRSSLSEGSDYCPFIENGALAISREGTVSPCLPLLYSHKSYFEGIERFSRRHVVGNAARQSIKEIWNDPAYAIFRERVQAFDFAPCTSCGGCALLGDNETDCLGNPFPVCGGCYWAQGAVQCP